MRLHDWSTVRRDVELDPATGKTHLVRLPGPRPDSAPVQGFAAFERSLWGECIPFALYRIESQLFFSAGGRRWNLTQPGLAFSHQRIVLLSRFRVLESGRAVFAFWYAHFNRFFMEMVDPTYDKLDEEHDFFLLFVAEYATSPTWQSNIRERWIAEPGVPLSPETARRLNALFVGAARQLAVDLLVTQCGGNIPLWTSTDPEGLERIRFAALKLSERESCRAATGGRDRSNRLARCTCRRGLRKRPGCARTLVSRRAC